MRDFLSKEEWYKNITNFATYYLQINTSTFKDKKKKKKLFIMLLMLYYDKLLNIL